MIRVQCLLSSRLRYASCDEFADVSAGMLFVSHFAEPIGEVLFMDRCGLVIRQLKGAATRSPWALRRDARRNCYGISMRTVTGSSGGLRRDGGCRQVPVDWEQLAWILG